MSHLHIGIAMVMAELIFTTSRVQVAWQRRQTIGAQNFFNSILVLLEQTSKAALFGLLLDRYQLFLSCLTDLKDVILGGSLTAYTEKANSIRLTDRTKPGIIPPSITFPVGIVSQITGRNSNRIIVG